MKTLFKYSLMALLCSLSMPALSGDYEKELLEDAKKGNRLAQARLSSYYCFTGKYPDSLYWLEQRAKQNRIYDMYVLAEAYYTGDCSLPATRVRFPPDFKKALKWYEPLISITLDDMGDGWRDNWDLYIPYEAKFRVADIYFFGEGGIRKNVMLAKRYYEELANIADSIVNVNEIMIRFLRGKARYRLARMHFYGDFARQDSELAFELASKAAGDDSIGGFLMFAYLTYQGIGTTQDKAAGANAMKRACKYTQVKKLNTMACLWYEDIKADRPLRKGDFPDRPWRD